MYSQSEVADWFLSKEEMSPKKLQKLMYYAYAWTLTLLNDDPSKLDNKLFDGEFEAWVHGPVIPEIYHEYKEFGYSPITKSAITPQFDEEVEDILNQVWEEYGHYTGNQLETITHQEDPWIKARGECSPLERCTEAIQDQDIFSYYILQAEEE